MYDLALLAPGLERGADGIWRARQRSGIDYPDGANGFCYQMEEHSFWFNHRNRCIVEAVRNYPPSGPIADIGAGNGYVALALQRAGFEVLVMEPGLAGARNAQSRGLDPVVCATLEDADLRPHSLAAAAVFDVIEHFADEVAFLQLLHRSLRPNGRLYLTVPAYLALWSNEDDVAGHHHRYTLGRLRTRLARAGFVVEYATYFFGPLPLPVYIFRTLPSRLGRRPPPNRAQAAAELNPSSGVALRTISSLLHVEAALIKRRLRIPTGTSCLVTARATEIPAA